MTKEFAKEIGQKIRDARESRNMTQQELANLLGYDSSQFVSLYERGKSKVPLSTLSTICDILKLNRKKIFNDIVDDYRNQVSQQFSA